MRHGETENWGQLIKIRPDNRLITGSVRPEKTETSGASRNSNSSSFLLGIAPVGAAPGQLSSIDKISRLVTQTSFYAQHEK